MRLLIIPLLLMACVVQAATPVRVAPLESLWVTRHAQVPARVVNESHSRISARVAGEVTDIRVQVGDPVEKGALLVVLDCRDYQLAAQALAAQQAALDARARLLQQQLQRAEALARSKSISQERLDQQRTERTAVGAEQRLLGVRQDQAALNIERCRIHAPFAGVVTARPVAAGDLVQPGTPVLSLLDPAAVELEARLKPQQQAELQQAGTLAFSAHGRDYPVQVRSALALLDASRTQAVRLAFPAAKPLSGAQGVLRWQQTAKAVPSRYLVRRDGVLGLMLAEQGRARFVALADALEGQAAVAELPADSQIVVAGHQALQHGDALSLSGEAEDAATFAD